VASVGLRILFFALWVPVAAVGSLVVARLAWRESRSLLVAILAGVIAAAGLVAFPRAVDDTASAARRNHAYLAAQPTRPGGQEDCLVKYVNCVHERVWAELRQLIPAHDRYYVQTGSGLISFWTFTSLLPRIAVTDAQAADWVISFHHDPRTLGVRLARRWTLGPVFTKGRKQTIVLAKVAR
jgi:hypothetical protein